MTEKSRRNSENSWRIQEFHNVNIGNNGMYRVEVIQKEMASAVRVLGGEGSAKVQITKAARLTGLAITTIERLRWLKIKRVPADIADTIRNTLEQYETEALRRAEHKRFIAEQKAEALKEELIQLRFDWNSE